MRRILFILGLLPLGFAAGGCNSNPLGEAQQPNVVDTVVLGALVGTSISTPSAFSIPASTAVRTDQTSLFDFAYNIESGSRHVFLPQGALGISNTSGVSPGLLLSDESFNELTEAPLNGYNTVDTLTIAVNQVWVARSSLVCTSVGVPVYAKLRILSFDDVNREVKFEVLANRNCGFRDLSPGIPQN